MTRRQPVRTTPHSAIFAAILLLIAAGFGRPASATLDVCLNAAAGFTSGCVANDVSFVTIGLGVQGDGCVNSNDSVKILLGALLTTTATTRYDVGMWVSTGGVSARTDAQCDREILTPVADNTYIGYKGATCTGAGVPPCPLNASGTGAFRNEDTDACGEIETQDSTTIGAQTINAIFNFPQFVTLPCTATAPVSGFVGIPTCSSWDNNSNTTCTTYQNAIPGTNSKCNCSTITSTIPLPDLSLSCSCPAQVKPGNSTACTVTFNNAVTCSNAALNPMPVERFLCGTASYLQFQTNLTATGSSIGQGLTPTQTTTNGTQTGVLLASPTWPPTPYTQIVWTPIDQVTSGNLGIIGAGQTGSMTFQYYVNPGTANGTYQVATVSSQWANTAPSSPYGVTTGAVAQSVLTASCNVTVNANATWASVVNVRAARENGRVALRWDTAGEVGTHGFEVERKDAKTGAFVTVTDHPLPALSSLPGGSYSWVDDSAPAAATPTYRIVEVEQSGSRQTYGPFTVAVEREGLRNAVAASDEPFSARAKGVSARVLDAAVAAVAASRSGPRAGDAAPTRVKVATSGAGLVRVDTAAIAAALRRPLAQVRAQLAAGRLALSHLGNPVAWLPTADGAGLEFYAEAIASPYTDNNVYWIDLNAAATRIADEAVTAPATDSGAAGSFAESLHLEQDRIAGIVSPTPVADYWIWQSLAPGYPGYDTATVSINVPHPVAGGSPRLDLTLYGFALEQELEVHVNGRYVDDFTWSMPGRYVAEVALPGDVLVDGANSVEIIGHQGSGGIWLDAMDLRYEERLSAVGDRLAFSVAAGTALAVDGFASGDVQIFDVADPAHPQRLAGARIESTGPGGWRAVFVAPSDGPFVAATAAALAAPVAVRGRAEAGLDTAANAAQYVVISPIELRSQADRLAAWRAQQGLSAKVVDLEDVMDDFAGGVYDATAIRRFLAYASQSWQTAPRYVALLGKGTFDYKNLLGLYSNLLPPLLVPTGDGLAPADAEYADFDGNGVPEMAVGRIPALTVTEAKAYVDKLIAYESTGAGGWAGQALMVADNPDKAGSFQVESDALASSLATAGLGISRVYLPPSPSAAQLATARGQLLSGFNTGFGLMNYVGHGGLDRLATEGLLLTTDVPQLGNGPRLPVMTALTCLIAQFAYPTFSSLGEDLVLQPSGGVVALYGPTWLSYDGEANRMGGYVVPEIERAGSDRLGDRLLRGIAAYAQSSSDRVQLSVYTLLGDPAVLPRR